MCWKNSSLCVVSRMTKVSSTNLSFRGLGGVVLSQGPWSQNVPYILAIMGLSGDPIAAPSTCS